MPSRKRQASSALQPAHHVKQPRLQKVRPDGTPSSPSESITLRWIQVGKDLFCLGRDTFLYVVTMPFSSLPSPSIEPESPIQEYPSSPSRSPSPLPNNAQDTSINSLSTSRRIRSKDPPQQSTSKGNHAAEDISLKLESLAFTPPSNQQPSSQSSDAAVPASPTPLPYSSQPVSQQSSITNFSFASTQSSQTTASSPSTQQAHPLKGESGQQKRGSTPRKDPRSRPHHIHHKRHKAAVKAEREKLRDQVVKQIHAIRSGQGFTGSEQDLSGLLSYERLIRNIKRGQRYSRLLGTLPPSDGLMVPFAPPEAKRLLDEEEAEEEEEQFLHRALERAKSTLNSPRPIKPYVPALEELEVRRRKKDKELENRLAVPSLPSTLPPDDEQKVKGFLQKRGVIAKFAREQVSDTDIRRLGPGQWLNDELINFYGALILDRAEGLLKEQKAKGGKGLDVHYFSTFFWSKLVNEGYEKGRLAKWTKKIDIFAKDIILIPVNHNNTHWTAAAINFRQKRLESYDSMAYLDQGVFEVLREYLEAESMNKKKKAFDWEGWANWAPKTTPQQENGFDCGVFTCQILRAVSRGDQTFVFSQKDMSYLRRRMIWEIGHAKLRDGYS